MSISSRRPCHKSSFLVIVLFIRPEPPMHHILFRDICPFMLGFEKNRMDEMNFLDPTFFSNLWFPYLGFPCLGLIFGGLIPSKAPLWSICFRLVPLVCRKTFLCWLCTGYLKFWYFYSGCAGLPILETSQVFHYYRVRYPHINRFAIEIVEVHCI